MFTKAYNEEITRYFHDQMELLHNRRIQLEKEGEETGEEAGLYALTMEFLEAKEREIAKMLESCGEEEGEALRFLYSAMPISDLLDYPASVYLAYARHGVFLWNQGPFAGKVPEKLFANYVLHHRINNEDMTDTRAFFYQKLIGRIAGKSMYDAVMEANIWCAEEATYQMTDRRAQNPITMYHTGIGRCGEESTFAITVLRSLGIPARQVYAPLWSHCDSNHAWVEAWCDGTWRILGACEPDEKLDMGWFIGPSTRAMQVHSRWYGKDAPEDPVVGKKGMSLVVNHLRSYAPTGILKVRVEDEQGRPVPGARVDFNVLNGCHFGNVATLYTESGETCGADVPDERVLNVSVSAGASAGTDTGTGIVNGSGAPVSARGERGTVCLDTGYGSLQIGAYANGLYGEEIVTLRQEDGPGIRECKVILHPSLLRLGEWRNVDFHAPRETVRDQRISDAQLAENERRLEKLAYCRQIKTERFYCPWEAERALGRFVKGDQEVLREILKKSLGNLGEVIRFLEWDFTGLVPELSAEGDEHWKLKALQNLREKDYWDIRSDVLVDCSVCAAPYAGKLPEEVFYRFLWNPRVADEMLRPCRMALLRCIPEADQARIRKNPGDLPALLKRLIIAMPDQEYGSLITSPMGSLTGGVGSAFSRDVLCVTIYRALGIPARLRPLDHAVEYYQEGAFRVCGRREDESSWKERRTAKLVLHAKGGLDFSQWEHYSVTKYDEGRFQFLFLGSGGKFPEGDLLVTIYRAITTNRLPNGDQVARVCDFVLADGEEKHLDMEQRSFSIETLLVRKKVANPMLQTAEGAWKRLEELSGEGKALFLWLEPGREPTEHILNELLEKQEVIKGLKQPVYLITLSPRDDTENATLKRTVEALPMLRLLSCSIGEAYREVAESVEQNPGRMPLAFVTEGGRNCIYSDAGYNVGMADLLLKILQ